MKSLAEKFALELTESEQAEWLANRTEEEVKALRHAWQWWARPEQIEPPGDWFVWLYCAGRGAGKTRTSAEWIRSRVERGAKSIAIVGRTAADYRDIMVKGPSGLLSIYPPGQRPTFQPSNRSIEFHTGARAILYSADKPDQIRGGNFDTVWADELASYRYPDVWNQIRLATRISVGDLTPRIVVSTTPRPIPLIRDLIKDPKCFVTKGSTFDNMSNLSPEFLKEMRRQYEGTQLGRQELFAEMLDEVKGALWKRSLFRYVKPSELPQLRRIVIGVDPSITSEGAEAGIVAFGVGVDGFGYVLGDHTVRGSPRTWAEKSVEAYHSHHADSIVAETNQGGEMVREMIKTVDPKVHVITVHAARGKRTRAEPVVSKYEQGRVKHCGAFPVLEDQLTSWDPNEATESPDRLDALVWAVTVSMLQGSGGTVKVSANTRPSYWKG